MYAFLWNTTTKTTQGTRLKEYVHVYGTFTARKRHSLNENSQKDIVLVTWCDVVTNVCSTIGSCSARLRVQSDQTFKPQNIYITITREYGSVSLIIYRLEFGKVVVLHCTKWLGNNTPALIGRR